MKFAVNKTQIEGSPDRFLRRAGYAYHRDRRSGKESYARRLGSGFFPKFHMYVSEQGDQVIFNLHLDQKQASYAGSNMHSGEYDGPVVEGEINRLSSLATHNSQPITQNNEKDMKDMIGHGDFKEDADRIKKKRRWWKIW